MIKSILIGLGISFLFLVNQGFSAYFYLSTEKSFLETDNTQVKIESQGTSLVHYRLYRVPDPEKFIRTDKNITRVYIESENIRDNPTDILFRFSNFIKNALRLYTRERFPRPEARTNAQKVVGDLFDADNVQDKIFIGRLKGFDLVQENEKKLSSKDGWSYTYLEFGKLKRGLYVAEVYSDNSIAYTMVHVSDIGMLIKSVDGRLLVQALQKSTGAADPAATVSVYDYANGQKIKEGKTTKDGIFDYSFAKNKYAELLVFARNKDDFTFYKLSLYPSAEKERTVYLYTDSPIYKPGQTVHLKGIVRDYQKSVYVVPVLNNVEVSINDPRGSQETLEKVKIGDSGTLEAVFNTTADSPPGLYRITALIDNKPYIGEFRLENYVKPKYKAVLKADKPVIVGSQKAVFSLKAEYFTGIPVSKAEVKYSIYRTPVQEDIFESEKNIFEDPSYAGKIEYLDNASGTTDDKGTYSFSFEPSKYKLDRDYAYIVKAEVQDSAQARAFVSSRIKVVRAEYSIGAAVGKPLYQESEKVSALVRLTYPDGTPAVQKKIAFLAQMEASRQEIAKGELVSDSKGNARLEFYPKGSGYLKITLTSKDGFGNEIKENIYTWIGKEGGTFVYNSGDITVVLDKSSYKVGEKAKMMVLSPVPLAKPLVATEREDIFNYAVKTMNGNSLFMDVQIKPVHAPNFYLSIQFMYNNQVYEKTVRIQVPPLDKVLDIGLSMDKKEYKPRDNGKISLVVKNASGKPVQNAEVSVAVINEALYLLYPEIFPDIRKFFYPNRWNSINNNNTIALRFYGYSRILRDKFAMNYYQKKLWGYEDFLIDQTGFAAMKDLLKKKDRSIFKDQILWEGMIKTDKEGKASVSVDFPDNLTEWRITAVAVTKDTLIGKGTMNCRTVKEVSADLSIPEFLTYADQPTGYIMLQNKTKSSLNYELKLETDRLTAAFSPQAVVVAANEEKSIAFKFKPTVIGTSAVRAEANALGKKDALVQSVEVMPISLKKVVYQTKIVNSDKDGLTLPYPADAIRETIRCTVGLTELESPVGAIFGALPYLKSYPYGCVEQTTSSFLPNLVAFHTSKKLGIDLPKTFSDMDDIMQKGLQKLYGYQNADGGWGWWDEQKIDIYMTAYVLYALGILKNANPALVNESKFKNGMNKLLSSLNASSGNDAAVAYALYVLSENGTTVPEQIKKLANTGIVSPYILSCLAIAAKRAGLDTIALDLVKKLEALAKSERYYSYWESTGDYYYGARIINTAMVLRALILVTPKSALVEQGVAYLVSSRKGSIWTSTRDTAECVYTLGLYVQNGLVKPSGKTAELYVNDKKIGNIDFGGKNYRSSFTLNAKDLPQNKDISVSYKGVSGNMVGDVRLEYTADGTDVKPESNGFSIKRSYYRVKDQTEMESLNNGTNHVKAGDVVLVELDIDADKFHSYSIIEDGMPAGFLPVHNINEYKLNVKLFEDSEHHEFGRGKASFFYRSLKSGKYFYLMQAIYPGSYYAPPCVVYDMYDTDTRGNTGSDLFNITE